MSHLTYSGSSGNGGNIPEDYSNDILNCKHSQPAPVSSASSLDSRFMMDLPDESDLFQSIQNALENDDTIADDVDDAATAEDAIGGSSGFLVPPSSDANADQLSYLAPSSSSHNEPLILPNTATTASSDHRAQAQAPAPAVTVNNTVPEFLYQLTRMLSEDNREIIEWSNGMCVCIVAVVRDVRHCRSLTVNVQRVNGAP